jgi:hypothetical protein
MDALPGRGPGEVTLTSPCGSGTGSRRSNSWSNAEKMVVLTPIPSASERMATPLTSGRRRRLRAA